MLFALLVKYCVEPSSSELEALVTGRDLKPLSDEKDKLRRDKGTTRVGMRRADALWAAKAVAPKKTESPNMAKGNGGRRGMR